MKKKEPSGVIQGRDFGNDRLMRLYLIDRYLCDSSLSHTAEEIMEYLNSTGCVKKVSKRTVYNDLTLLETFPDSRVSLQHDEPAIGIARRYRMERGGGLFRRSFRESEAHLLREVLDIIGSFDGFDRFGEGSELVSLYAMTRLTAPTRKIVDLGIFPHSDPSLFSRLYKIVADRSVIRLRYRTMAELNTDAEIREIVFHPYRIRYSEGRWILVGADEKDGFICQFFFNQIVEAIPIMKTEPGLTSMKRQYPLKEGKRLDAMFENIIGLSLPRALCVAEDNSIETSEVTAVSPLHIIVAAFPSSANYIEAFPFHPDQDEYDPESEEVKRLRARFPNLPPGIRFFFFEAYDTPDLTRALMTRGDAVIVLKPESLRRRIASSLIRLTGFYTDAE